MPPSLKEAILAGYDRLADRVGTPPPVAVRSSAVGEDSHLSFAGQFHTVLNVTREGLLEAYLQVIASLYSPEAVHYRMVHGIPGESAEMAVGVIAMIPAVVSGVAFSQDPNCPRPREVLIQAVRGSGVTLVEGKDSPEVVRVSLPSEPPQIVRVPSAQTTRVVAAEPGGVREEPLAPEAGRSTLPHGRGSASNWRSWARDLEQHFGSPQDVEWAVTEDRRLFLLQSRPLRIARASVRTSEPVPGYPVLLSGGEVACPGVGSGPAVPPGRGRRHGLLPHGCGPGGQEILPPFRAAHDQGPGHCHGRWKHHGPHGVPGQGAAGTHPSEHPDCHPLHPARRAGHRGCGKRVRVQGEVPSLLEQQEALGEAHDTVHRPRSSPDMEIMERAVPFLAPLNLTDPQASGFAPEGCRTLHDLARYVHERSYQEMFGMGERLGDFRAASYHLDVFLPVDLYIIDLGGGLKEIPKGKR